MAMVPSLSARPEGKYSGRFHAARARHVLHDDVGLSGQMLAHVAGDSARAIDVKPAAGIGADHDGEGFCPDRSLGPEPGCSSRYPDQLQLLKAHHIRVEHDRDLCFPGSSLRTRLVADSRPRCVAAAAPHRRILAAEAQMRSIPIFIRPVRRLDVVSSSSLYRVTAAGARALLAHQYRTNCSRAERNSLPVSSFTQVMCFKFTQVMLRIIPFATRESPCPKPRHPPSATAFNRSFPLSWRSTPMMSYMETCGSVPGCRSATAA